MLLDRYIEHVVEGACAAVVKQRRERIARLLRLRLLLLGKADGQHDDDARRVDARCDDAAARRHLGANVGEQQGSAQCIREVGGQVLLQAGPVKVGGRAGERQVARDPRVRQQRDGRRRVGLGC